MKRSEVINEICEEMGSHDLDKVSFDTQVKLAESILARLESIGMLPPKAVFKDPGHFPGDTFEYELNEWEAE